MQSRVGTKATIARYLMLVGLALFAVTATTSFAQTTEDLTNPEPGDWPRFLRTPDGQRYSPLDRINRDNVDQLRLAWSRNVGFDGSNQSTPVVWDGVLYFNGPNLVVAMDATTGEELWRHEVELNENTGFFRDRQRGSVVPYEGNVYWTAADGRLIALDQETGEEVWSTQVGEIQFSEGFSTGPLFADGKLVVGPSGADAGGVNGRVVALDAENGEILWTFNLVPQPGEPGYETWDPPESAVWGGGSAWNAGVYDPETGTVIYGAGQPTPWGHFGTRGDPSPDLYTASTVAVDIETGELEWYFQTVPGDEWDYDQHPTSTVADLTMDGETRRVVINPTTTGYIEVFDIETGELLDAYAMNPEYTVHLGYEEDGTPIIDEEQRFNEPGETMRLCPFRWVNYQPSAFSPETGLYYSSNNHNCYDYTLNEDPPDWQPGESPQDFELSLRPDEFDRLGGVTAVDPATGEVAWEFESGYFTNSGVAATGGGLVFVAWPDRVFRALDAETGEALWEQVVPAAMHGAPITYEVDGTQYVAVNVGTSATFEHQSGLPDTVTGEASVFVFALP